MRRDADVEPAAGQVVEEEERLGALGQHVVDAHGHQIDAQRRMSAHCLRHFHLDTFRLFKINP